MATKNQRAQSEHSPAGWLTVTLSSARLGYHGRTLFDGLDLTLPAGRTTCLLGESGVGKSSLLRLLAGLQPDGTEAEVRCSDDQPLAGRVAYMDQRDLLLPWASVIDNVCLGAKLRGEPADRVRAANLLRAVGLADHVDDRPDTLSGGMRQRAALARTLMEDRPVVLMDEPFSALDALTRFKLQALAAELLCGRTVLLGTQDPMEAFRLGHHILVMRGRPVTLDPPFDPDGSPPRDPTTASLQARYGELLARLAAEAVA